MNVNESRSGIIERYFCLNFAGQNSFPLKLIYEIFVHFNFYFGVLIFGHLFFMIQVWTELV